MHRSPVYPNLIGALAVAVFILGTAAGTLSVVSATSLAHIHADRNGGDLLELERIL
ncbi:MAG: hypothetical protein KKH72_02270 [Alphaproteobacteria bacterium]|nr:hypothetical protein [Alphaproteobacteria bacterium]